MKPPTVRVTPSWWLWWSPNAWKLAKRDEAFLQWWLLNPKNEDRLIEMLFKGVPSLPTQPSIKRGGI